MIKRSSWSTVRTRPDWILPPNSPRPLLLTLRADEASFRAIRMEQDALNRIDEQRWGDRFIETLNTRRAHERNMESVRGKMWQEQESMKDKVLLAFTCSHPLALDDFLDNPAPVVIRDHADMRDALANSLIAISKNIEGYNQPWNAYSNAAYKLDAFVQSDRRSMRNGLLTDNECAESRRISGASYRVGERIEFRGHHTNFRNRGQPPII